MEIKDEEIREKLSKILGSYKEKDSYGSYNAKREVEILSWIEIAFEIGKLKKNESNPTSKIPSQFK